jgi:hypothetical protein
LPLLRCWLNVEVTCVEQRFQTKAFPENAANLRESTRRRAFFAVLGGKNAKCLLCR